MLILRKIALVLLDFGENHYFCIVGEKLKK